MSARESEVPAIPERTSEPDAPPSGPDSAVQLSAAHVGHPSTRFRPTVPRGPFTENPTACGEPLQSGVDVLGYDDSLKPAPAASFPEITGCDVLDFNPSLAARPSTDAADSPSGLDVELTVPQFESPTVPSPSEIRGTEMVLPEGFSINSNAADGKTSCSDAAGKLRHHQRSQLPRDLEDRHPRDRDGASARAPAGLPLSRQRHCRATATGSSWLPTASTSMSSWRASEPDPTTGQIRVIFEDLPQTPFQKFSLHIFGSERGALATPTKCGTYGIKTTFTPWDTRLGQAERRGPSSTIDRGPERSALPGSHPSLQPGLRSGIGGQHRRRP